MRLMNLSAAAIFTMLAVTPTNSQTYAPIVTMSVTAPDGQLQEVTARESATATLTLKDGSEYLLRPTIHDEPFTTVTVAIFKAATANEATSLIAEVQAKRGGAPVETKSKPAFKIAIKSIDLPKKTS